MKYGKFTAYVFQDLLAKGYLFAISYGNLRAEVQYTRIHSSCVTSETFRALNCDCKKQLNAALKKCVEGGNGIIFYLFQEGRGAGAIPKCRGLQLCQYLKENITTFEGYRRMGLKPDYRNFDSVGDICKILKINAKWILLTNNPDKIDQFTKMGFDIIRVENLEIKPSPYNIIYLRSKKEFGHHLVLTKDNVESYEPPDYIVPFEPVLVESCRRFIYTSCSYQPIKPVGKQIIVSEEHFEILKKIPLDIIAESKKLRRGYFVKLNYPMYQKLEDKVKDSIQHIIKAPYWFKFHIYYDLTSDTEYAVLEYAADPKRVPLVRFFSEATLNRFPMVETPYKDRYKRAIEKIYEYGHGFLIFYFKDGQGQGLGSYVVKMESKNENDKNLGLSQDRRDYSAFANLARLHIGGNLIRLLERKNSPQLETTFTALNDVNLKVQQVIDVDAEGTLGHDVLTQRIESITTTKEFKTLPKIVEITEKWIQTHGYHNKKINFTIVAVGQSKAHAFYLQNLINSYSHHSATVEDFDSPFLNNPKNNLEASILVIISQGVSPNCQIALAKQQNFEKTVLLTAVTEANKDQGKVDIVKKIKEDGGLVINFPLEDEYVLLIRVVGPFFGFLAAAYFAESFLQTKICHKLPVEELPDRLEKLKDVKVPQDFYDCLAKYRNVVILASSPLQKLAETLSEKLMEGLYFNKPPAYNFLDFPHGIFQSLEVLRRSADSQCCFLVLHNGSEKDDALVAGMKTMIGDKFPVWELRSTLDIDFQILEYDMILNYFILDTIISWDVDQINFPSSRNELYKITKLPF
jgi:3,4-dihydroxy 2-butanone 4-phosphate synthase/GTP cyclohydrolase II